MTKTKQEVNHFPTIESLRRELLVPGNYGDQKFQWVLYLIFGYFGGETFLT